MTSKNDSEILNLNPLSGSQVTEIITQIYDILEPGVACNLVNPNVILTIAGIKPYADIHWIPYTKNTEEKVQTANEILKKYDLELSITLDENSNDIADGFITNRKGLERITHLSKFKWVPKYNSVTGKKGHAKWYRETLNNLNEMLKNGDIVGDRSLEILFSGIKIGYPDQAILDYEDAIRLDNRGTLILVKLNYPKEYELTTAIPNFHFYPEHLNEVSIKNWIDTANIVFAELYNSEWYYDLVKTPVFLKALEQDKFAQEKGLKLVI